MTLRLIIKNPKAGANAANKIITLAPGQHYTLQAGDIARALDRTDVKIFKKKQNLIIRTVNGEEYVLENFYVAGDDSAARQIFSWDDNAGESRAVASGAMQPSVTSDSVAPVTADAGAMATDSAAMSTADTGAASIPQTVRCRWALV